MLVPGTHAVSGDGGPGAWDSTMPWAEDVNWLDYPAVAP